MTKQKVKSILVHEEGAPACGVHFKEVSFIRTSKDPTKVSEGREEKIYKAFSTTIELKAEADGRNGEP